jgi:hypothetical protein
MWTILFIVSSSTLAAQDNQNFVHFEEIILKRIPEGDSDQLISYPYSTKHFSFSNSPELNHVYLLHDQTLVEINLNSREWTSTQFDSIPTEQSRLGYSSYHKSLLFWDFGVGRVYQLDSTYTFNRIDNSFNHRSQYFHLPWIDQETGSIYAMGGYGLFDFKNHLVRFNVVTGTWEMVEIVNQLDGPGLLMAVTGIFDNANQLIYVISYDFSFEESNTGTKFEDFAALWRYSVSSRVWDKIYRFNSPNIKWVQDGYSDMLKTKHTRLPMIMFTQYGSTACFYHTESNVLRCLENMQINEFYIHNLHGMFWSESDNAYYFVGAQLQTANESFFVKIIKMTITDEQAFMNWLEGDVGPWYAVTRLWMTIGVLSVGLLVFGFYYRRRTNSMTDLSVTSTEHIITLVKSENGEFLLVGQNRTIDGIPEIEQKLLSKLVEVYRSPDSYLKSDEIDMILLPDHPSQDYIRRLRNLTLERLEGLFRSAGDQSVDYILRRPTLVDKRKNEYRLNDIYVRLGGG